MTNPQQTTITPNEPIDLLEWVQENTKWLAVGAATIVAAVLIFWLVSQSRVKKERNAAEALFVAKQSIQAGNAALAQSDLMKLVSRYGSTSSGSEAAMLLAQINFDQNKFEEGVAVLKDALDDAPEPLQASIHGLIGDGYLGMKNATSAAKEYELAAEVSAHDMDRANQMARAARAYMAANDTAKAREVWTSLAEDQKNPSVSAEAKVRLGEMTAKPAKAG